MECFKSIISCGSWPFLGEVFSVASVMSWWDFRGAGCHYSPSRSRRRLRQRALLWPGWVQGWSCWASASWNTPRPFLLGDQTFLRKRGPLFCVLIQRTGNSPHVKYSFQDLWESIMGWCAFLCSFLWSKGLELLGETSKAGENSAYVN